MPSLKDIKNQINSVGSTKKITSAMKMVAASKLRRSQERAEAARPYSSRLEEMLSSLASSGTSGEGVIKLLTGSGKDNNYIVVPVTADRGLCGGFNTNIVKQAKNYFNKILKESKNLKIITVGTKGLDQLKREYGKYIVKKIDFKNKKKISFKDASLVGDEIVKLFKNNEFDKCIIFYNKFKNVMTQIPQSQQLIPAKKEEVIKTEQESSYDFEPEEDEILEDLLPKNISTQIYKGFLENSASEQGSRMTAMDNATRNAGDLVEKLTINYNRSRQAAITKELIEIISGAESL